jgi:high-affinity iron transporter
MWQGFLIGLREGLESFLIVALTLSYLKRTGRDRLARAVVAGIAASLAVCAAAGYGLSRAANQPLWEGILACTATVLVGSLLVYVLRSAKTLRADMERRIQRAAGDGLYGGFGGVFLFTVLMITREGMETVLLITTAVFQARSTTVAAGLALGLVSAVAVAVTWKQLGRKVNLGALLNISAVFLAVFLAQLVLYSVHELAEAGVLPNAESIHNATEILGPDGVIGHIVTYALAAVPTAWLAWAWLRSGRAAPAQVPAQSDRRPPQVA